MSDAHNTTGCSACGMPRLCEGCEMIEGAFTGMRDDFSPQQEAALDAYWQAEGPDDERAAYYHLAEVGLPLCNVEPSFGRKP